MHSELQEAMQLIVAVIVLVELSANTEGDEA